MPKQPTDRLSDNLRETPARLLNASAALRIVRTASLATAFLAATNAVHAQTVSPAATPASDASNPSATTPVAPVTENSSKSSKETGVQLGKVHVVAQQEELQPLTVIEAKETLSQIAGGVGIINQADLVNTRIGTNADILAYQPGVFAQAEDGNDAIKISIRGSGINKGASGSFRSGIYFLFDGLPVTGPGGTPYELFEALGLNYTEVLKGANAFSVGSTFLGGALNYVTKTGYDAPPFALRLEGGSFGYIKGQVESGYVHGKLDYYTSITKHTRQGVRDNTRAESNGIAANLGYRISPKIQNRFYLRYRNVANESGNGALSRDEIQSDPTQNSPTQNPDPLIRSTATRVQPGSTWVANKTTVTVTPDSQLELSVVWHDYPIDQRSFVAGGGVNNVAYPTNNVPAGPNSPFIAKGALVPAYPNGYYNNGLWTFQDLTGVVNYTRTDTVFDHEVASTLGIRSTTHIDAGIDTIRTDPVSGARTLVSSRYNNGSSDNAVFAAAEIAASKDFFITAGLTGAYFRRTQQWLWPITPETGPDFVKDTYHLLGRAGFRWEAAKDVTIFGNVSQSVEPPNAWNFSGSTPGVADAQFTRPISGITGSSSATNYENMTAVSYELGGRAKVGIFEGSLAFFRSRVEDELITIVVYEAGQIDPNTGLVFLENQTSQFNSTPTIKQGIELGLDITVWEERSASGGAPKSSVVFRNAFTYNDFQYENDKFYKKNELPGIPKFFYQGGLNFQHSTGFFGGISTEISSDYPVTFWNTRSQYADSYQLWGANVGYRARTGRWSLSVDFRNITDEHYSGSAGPSASTVAATSGATALRVYRPGEPFGVTGVFTFTF